MTMRRRTRTLVAVAAVGTVGLLATTAVALTSDGSREVSQDTRGVIGATENADFFGAALAVGDFNGDGFGDVAVGVPHEDIGTKVDAGLVQVLYGTAAGVTASGDTKLTYGTRGVAGKAAPDDLFGSALAVGDFDNDGFDDLAVGVPGRDSGDRKDTGIVLVFLGGETGLTGRDSHKLAQDVPGVPGDHVKHRRDYFGHSLVAADFDNDGHDDLAVGAPGDRAHERRAGAVTVFNGGAKGVTRTGIMLTQDTPGVGETAEEDDAFGWSLAAGDFDNDSYPDLAVGVPGEKRKGHFGAGIVQVFRGSATGIDPVGDTTYSEATPGVDGAVEDDDRFGTALAAGDFDGNGFDDLAIGVPGESRRSTVSSGVVQVLSGGATGLTGADSRKITQASEGVSGDPEFGDDFGAALAVGDFNGNGRDDLGVGVPGEAIGALTGAGLVHAFYGGTSGVRTDNSQVWYPGRDGLPGSPQANAGVGRALAIGDIDGDGRDDLVVGVPGRTVGAAPGGGTFIVIRG